MMIRTIAFALSLCLSGVLPTQQKPLPDLLPGAGRPPALLVRTVDDERSRPIQLVKIDTHVVIRGFLAETTTTMTFRNPHNRVLEGEMVFPLPDGATISGYALDIGGRLTPSVAVEKHQARIAFETEMYTRIDPGLIEWTRGSNFRTRVWPINPRDTRTIQVSYISELDVTSEAATYLLPLRYPDPIEQFDLRIEVVKAEVKPVIVNGDLANLKFSKWEDRWITEASMGEVRYQTDLRIAVPRPEAEAEVLIERGEDDEHYFAAIDLPTLPDNVEPIVASRIAIIWDVSLSRAKADKQRELELLDRHLAQLGDVKVDIVLLSNDIMPPLALEVRDSDTSEVIETLEHVAYDGGTNLAALEDWLDRPGQAAHDYYLLFSDGMDNLGGELPTFDIPVFTIASSSSADHRRLDHLARMSGGAHVDLNRLAIDDALDRFGRTPYSIDEIRFDESKVADVLPEPGRPVGPRIVFTGRLLADEANITVIYSDGAESTFSLRRADATETDLVPRHWAQMQVDELAVFPEEHRDRLLTLGMQFSMVTPATSLLVLERLNQYVRHHIEPPAGLPEMRKQYLAMVREVERDEQLVRNQKLERVVAMWQQRVNWWEREFIYPEDLHVAANDTQQPSRASFPGAARRGAGEGQGRGGADNRMPGRSVEGAVASPGGRSMGSGGGGGGGLFGDPEDDSDRLSNDIESFDYAPALDFDAALDQGASRTPKASIQILPWDPEQPYLLVLKTATPEEAYALYLHLREKYFSSPSFYLDCADFFFQLDRPTLSLRILTNILDLDLDNPALLRVVAHRLDQTGELRAAANLFEEVRRLRPEEPQSHRDLALVLAKLGEYHRAVELYQDVVMETWDGRFPEIEVVALMELNRLLAKYGDAKNLAADLDDRLIKLLDLDVRIVMTWDADRTDIDLWVIEPSGEQCNYNHNLTTIGGLLSRDFTGGYGPEEYVLNRAMPGSYRIKAHFFGSNQQDLTGATTLQLTIITNFGRTDEHRESITVRLDKPNAIVDVGTVEIGRTAEED